MTMDVGRLPACRAGSESERSQFVSDTAVTGVRNTSERALARNRIADLAPRLRFGL